MPKRRPRSRSPVTKKAKGDDDRSDTKRDLTVETREQRALFLRCIDKIEGEVWGNRRRAEELRLSSIKISGICNHMHELPGDFPAEFLPEFKLWTEKIRVLDHKVRVEPRSGQGEGNVTASVMLQLRNGNKLLVDIVLDDYWSLVTDVIVLDEHRTKILNISATVDHFDQLRWDQLTAGEAPGSSFLLRFFCFLGLTGYDLRKRSLGELGTCDRPTFTTPQNKFIYERYPFFQEYWQHRQYQVTTATELLPPLIAIVLHYLTPL